MSSQNGPCAKCGESTPKYGPNANPLCAICLEQVRAARGGKY
ncbi:hypothetical protein ABTY96_03085 [Streptomyces sp. NPDC096057]